MNELTTTQTDVATNSEYEMRLTALAAEQATMAGDILQFHYRVGRLADDMRNAESEGGNRSTYGEGVVAHIAEHLGRNEREIHACLKFARRYTQQQVNELKERRWPWRGVAALLTTYDAETMNEFRERYEKDELAAALAKQVEAEAS
jgi:hypothetical protein